MKKIWQGLEARRLARSLVTYKAPFIYIQQSWSLTDKRPLTSLTSESVRRDEFP